MLDINSALTLLDQPKKIFITTHHKPDGDALGSSLGLYHYLKQKGHFPTVVSPSEVPDFLMWMPGIETVHNFESEPEKCKKILKESDLIFCLDFNNLSRIKLMEELLNNANQPKILIDHHLQPDENAFQYGLSDADKSSTCELIYDFILLDQGAALLSKEVMECLYTGVMTDTGSFRFPSTTASVHEMVADFKNRGLEHGSIHHEIYDTWSERRMRFLGFLLNERMEIFHDQKTGIISVSQEDIKKYNANSGDTEGVVNYILSIHGIQTAILVIERKEEVKLSFRSKGNIDVSEFSRNHFNGGGHFNAAGGQSKDSLAQTLLNLKKLLHLH